MSDDLNPTLHVDQRLKIDNGIAEVKGADIDAAITIRDDGTCVITNRTTGDTREVTDPDKISATMDEMFLDVDGNFPGGSVEP